jgi:hypothetical protein
MGGVSLETCWASYKHVKINFDTLLHLVGYFCMNYTMMHGSTNINRRLRHNTGLLYHTPHHNRPCNVLVFTGELQKERFAWKDICIRPQLWEYFKPYKFVSWNKLRYFTWGTGGRETTGSRTAASISWWFLHPSPLCQLGIHNILATTKHL